MPDRSLRLPLSFAFGLPHGGERGSTLLRDGRPSSPPQGSSSDSGGSGKKDEKGEKGEKEDNPFAPPPEGTPDQPWRPRPGNGGEGEGDASNGRGRSPWGSQWSDRQPGRSQGGGFGERPGQQGPEGPSGSGSGGGNGGGMRWDPTDPAQRRARYALLSGMWAFFFALFGWRYVALLLGALALNWGISSLRAKPKQPDPTAPATQKPVADPASSKPQRTAAISGLVTASLALAMVAATFAAQLVYRDYYTCVSDALTSQSEQECSDLLPEQLRPLLEERE
ncbi:hypothetical protein GCM10010277_59950 [Streptomyces longisporoflavus]|uniref:hypothetical protein n=1 Tax=Streptomyces longisporoflavus TaxID=28044 RepID=UPI00167D95EB|nr:hypothetical protein [Streptomyces longisporoflavus]GGV57741.1 hypothetical protein GCM10010277_59950 [Streptomyces longisporoflavus]